MMPRPSIYYNDNDPMVCAWIRQLMFDGLIPYGVVDSRSILDVQPADLEGFTQCHFFCGIAGWAYALKLAGWPATRPVWTGSPPCQPFSAAGKLEGKEDARHLGPKFISLVRACRPPVLFGEQVASAAVFGKSAKRAGGEPEWAWLDDLSDRLEAAHYAVGASDIPAAGVGAPHIRQRTFFGAVRLADANGRDACAEREQRSGQQRLKPQDGGPERLEHPAGNGRQQRGAEPSGRGLDAGCGPERLADANEPGSQGRQGMPQRPVECAAGSGGMAGGQPPSGTDHGGWDDVDWLFCRDGKWRPVKSSVQRLADGLPGSVVPCSDFVPASSPLAQSTKEARRVMRLRGYGNAIVSQAAALFIRAFDTTVSKWQ
jgi:DNA (cytosine-5)-methyltransferase 1